MTAITSVDGMVLEEIFAAVYGEMNETERKLLSFYLKHIDSLDQEVSELTQLLSDLFDGYKPQLEIATSIPGINLDSAMEILAEISPEPQKIVRCTGKVCKWAGLTLRNDESAGMLNPARHCTETPM